MPTRTAHHFHATFEQARADALAARFRDTFGAEAAFVVRAPGRVNLLGEHTDYNGLPVLPMAIDRSAMIAGRARHDKRVYARNTDSRFAPRDFRLADEQEPYSAGDWGNYVKAAANGLTREIGSRLAHGADLLVDGNVPSGAGLSSSSALVVASALALNAANDVDMPYPALAEMLPRAEQFVGTLSGGMDQAISLLAQTGRAMRIDFFPLRVRPVPLPEGCRVVVCHSLVAAEKSGAAKLAYNQRVIEGRLACRVLESALGSNLPRSLQTLGDLITFFPGRLLSDFLPHFTQALPEAPLCLSEIAAVVGSSTEALAASCEIPNGLPDRFAIVPRVRHVLSEADRVGRAEEALQTGDVIVFGALMDASHASCRDDYEISCPELETLVHNAKQAGALGARLTGAGFGGCTVNLVPAADVDRFLAHIDDTFYVDRLAAGQSPLQHRFVFAPQPGAEVVHRR